MQMKCSFQHFCVQYEFGFWNENVLRVQGGYLKKSWLTNCAKMRILIFGGTTIQIGILHVLLNILFISLLSTVHNTSGYFEV